MILSPVTTTSTNYFPAATNKTSSSKDLASAIIKNGQNSHDEFERCPNDRNRPYNTGTLQWYWSKMDTNDAMLSETKVHIDLSTGKLDTKTGDLFDLASFRENGISKYVDWDLQDLSFRLSNVGLTNGDSTISDEVMEQFNIDTAGFTTKDSQEIIGFLSSKYAVLQNQLKQDFSGDELKTQMDSLDTVMDKHIEAFAKNFSESVGGFYEDNGMSGERAKMYNSIKSIISNQTQAYSEFISKNSDYAHVKNTQDSWLERASDYMASHLRVAYREENSTPATTDGLYNIDDLKSAADFEIVSTRILKSEYGDCSASEEELGVRFGMMALKAERFLETSTISDERKSALKSAVTKRTNKLISEMDDSLEKWRKDFTYPGASKGCPALNKDVIFNMLDVIKNSYAETKDVSASLLKGISAGYEQYNAKENEYGDVFRYRYSAFWEKMFTKTTLQSDRYYQTVSTADQMVQNMNEFFHYIGIQNSDISFFNFHTQA